jgi:hypothetical protein
LTQRPLRPSLYSGYCHYCHYWQGFWYHAVFHLTEEKTMSMTIAKNGLIAIDFNSTGLVVMHDDNQTQVFKKVVSDSGDQYEPITMPHLRYSLTQDKPKSGVAGRAQFEKDILAYLKKNP